MENRTLKSLKNSQISTIFYLAILSISFISRKVFINNLGPDLLGLNSTAMNLLSFLNLAELGIGTAIAYSLYDPLYREDKITVNEIVSLQGYLYRIVAILILICSSLLMFFFPIIFNSINFPIWYVYATFSVFLFDSLLSYIFNYKQIVLNASQQTYKIVLVIQTWKIIIIILQILAIIFLRYTYIWWLLLEFIGAIMRAYFLNYTIKKNVPYLNTNIDLGAKLKLKYVDIIRRTRQLFIHRLAGFILLQTSPLIIFAYTSLKMVAVYANYMLIINGIRQFIFSVFNGITASIGNLLKEGNNIKSISFFYEFFVGLFILASVLCFSILRYSAAFITLWVGKEYILNDICLYLLVAILFLSIIRMCYDVFCEAAGISSDVWATIVEAIINLGGALILGYWYNLIGVLSGVLLSLLFKFILWKPYFLFKKLFNTGVGYHFKIYANTLICLISSFITTKIIFSDNFLYPSLSYYNLALSACIVIGFFFILLTTTLYLTNKYVRLLVYRVRKIITKNNFIFT